MNRRTMLRSVMAVPALALPAIAVAKAFANGGRAPLTTQNYFGLYKVGDLRDIEAYGGGGGNVRLHKLSSLVPINFDGSTFTIKAHGGGVA